LKGAFFFLFPLSWFENPKVSELGTTKKEKKKSEIGRIWMIEFAGMRTVLMVAGAVFVMVTAAWLYSEMRIRRLERVVDSAKQKARASEVAAAAAESAAGEYRKKIEHLEAEIEAIGTIARRQDEELGKIVSDVGAARRDVERARSIRAVGATAGELCAKLDELGHPCR
jgi:flagellar biosynthesis/type III secretory pathway M-ring protein FliF/YscJ